MARYVIIAASWIHSNTNACHVNATQIHETENMALHRTYPSLFSLSATPTINIRVGYINFERIETPSQKTNRMMNTNIKTAIALHPKSFNIFAVRVSSSDSKMGGAVKRRRRSIMDAL